MSTKNKQKTQRRSTPKGSKSPLANKAKENNDTIYIIQNQNEILKLKNIQMEQKINSMKLQLSKYGENLAQDQRHCQSVRSAIKMSHMTQDIKLQAQKRSVQDKIALLKGNFDILVRKINQTRQASILEEDKIPNIKQDKVAFQKQLWDARAQNEGTKIVLKDLQKQLQKLKGNNQVLMSMRKQYGPVEKQVSQEIEDKIQLVKNKKNITDQLRKKQAPKLLNQIIILIEKQKKNQAFVMIERFSLSKKNMQKRVFLLSLIRKKYTHFIKNKTLQSFKTSFRPLQEQKKFSNIILQTRKRRMKNKMFRIWRNQYVQTQYQIIRKFEAQNSLQKLTKAITKSNLFSTFNMIKHWQKNPLHQRSIQIIDNITRDVYSRVLNWFMSSLVSAQNNFNIKEQIDESAKQQSTLLTLSAYFSNWAKRTKQSKLSNRVRKFRYFRELKKLLAMKKKRALSQMLTLTNNKINDIDKVSTDFCQLKKYAVHSMMNELNQDLGQVQKKNQNISSTINKIKGQKKDSHQELALLKISRYLKGKVDKAFQMWRKHNRKINKFKLIYYMFSTKMGTDINYAFSCIQRRKFQKLKLSIAQKIQSCEYSYNYLVEQNKHIKEVLDRKTLDLEKSKFVAIIRRLIRSQKQTKHKYFYAFMRNGLKYWKFRKVYQKIDLLIQRKMKIAFIFMLKFVSKEIEHQQKIQNFTQNIKQLVQKDLIILGFIGFQKQLKKVKKIKKILANISDRNLQLNVYNSFNIIKRNNMTIVQKQLQQEKKGIVKNIWANDGITEKTQKNIQVLRQRLQDKQFNIFNRIVLTARITYIRNCSNRGLHYFNRWRGKVDYQNRVKRFAEILQRKSRILLKNRFIMNLFKKQGETELGQLKTRLKNYQDNLQESSKEYQNFLSYCEKKSNKMNQQNQFHLKEGEILQKKTQRMDDIKLKGHGIQWGFKMSRFVFREWKKRRIQFKEKWNKVYETIKSVSQKNTFMLISQEMREQILKNRIKTNLSNIYSKKFRHNAGLGFRIWRLVNLNTKVIQFKQCLQIQASLYSTVQKRLQKMTNTHLNYVDFRANDRKLRKIIDFMKKYTKRKLQNNGRKKILDDWLKKGYQAQFYNLFKLDTQKNVIKTRKAQRFIPYRQNKKTQQLFYHLKGIVQKKKTIKKLFINRFVFHQLQKVYQEFFTKTKSYFRYVEVTKKNQKTSCIQKVIETFEKKRKNTLCHNFRRWRRNQYEIHMSKILFKRLTRKSIINRYAGMFYPWKLECQAKNVLHYHQQQGQVKKRKVQIQRLQKFIDDFKKSKGLLLQNQEGNFVMSPRFAKKKQQTEKKQNNLKYKFISRLIMSMNGYNAPIRGYCNMQVYMRLREKYRKGARFVLNHLRKPDLLLAFKTWKKASSDFRDMFQSMERKDLIKFLNRQKDKMQMQYSKKIQADEKIQTELKRFKILSHQRQRKQKLCAHIFIKNANKVKKNAFQSWRKKIEEIRDDQCQILADKGYSKIQDLEDQLRQLQYTEREFQQNNQHLRQAVSDALDIAEMVKRISQQRDKLSNLILQKNLTCESLTEENQVLNSKLYLAQKEAMKLLIISNQQP